MSRFSAYAHVYTKGDCIYYSEFIAESLIQYSIQYNINTFSILSTLFQFKEIRKPFITTFGCCLYSDGIKIDITNDVCELFGICV